MKRIMMGAALVAMAMVGCTNEEVVKNSESQMFTLEVGKGMESRTHLNGNQLVWSAGDEIFVTSPDGEVSGVLRLISGENTPHGVFRGEVNGNPKNLKNIVYPVQLGGMNLANADAQKLVAPMTGTIDGENTLNLNCGLAKMNVLGLEDGNRVKISANGIGRTLRYDLQTNKWIPMETSNNDITIHNAEDATDFIVPVYTENTDANVKTVLEVSVINQDEEGDSTPVEVAIVKEQANEETPILAVTDDGAVVDPKTSDDNEVTKKYVYVNKGDNVKNKIESAEDESYIILQAGETFEVAGQINIHGKSMTIMGGENTKIKDTSKERNTKTFQIYANWNNTSGKGVNIVMKNFEICSDIAEGACLWITSGSSEISDNEDSFKGVIKLEDIICELGHLENYRVKDGIIELHMSNCDITQLTVEAAPYSVSNFNTYSNVWFDEMTKVGIKLGDAMKDQKGIENITIMGNHVEWGWSKSY